MTATENYQLDDRFTADHGQVFLTGTQALARLPVDQLRADRRAGLNTAAFVSGYPGSPLGGFDGAVARAAALAPELPIVCRPGVNEELAVTAVMGSQLANTRPDARYDGVLGIWYGKAPGVDRAADALRHAVFAGTWRHGGAVALVGDDPMAKSSTLPSSSAGVLADMQVPLLYPADPAEALDLARHAVALSRSTGLWVALKMVSDVADGTATVQLDPDRIRPVLPLLDGEPYTRPPNGHLITPMTIDIERDLYEVRHRLAMQYASDNDLDYCTVDPPDAWIGIASSGITYREVREALRRLGLRTDAEIADAGIRLLKMRMPIPFKADTMRVFARGLEELFIVEEKQPNVELLVKEALYSLPDRPLVVGKVDEHGANLLPAFGGLDADRLVPALRRRLERRLAERLVPDHPDRERVIIPLSVERSPFFCSGCPHNRSTEVPEGTLVGAGIGCSTMILFMDPERVGDTVGITCMGNEGTQWIGISPFVETKHFVQNLGDGTYFHSGQLAIQAAVAAGVTMTYKLLLNGAVAMTGGQLPQGQVGPAAICTSLLAHGVAKIIVTTDDTGRYRDLTLPDGVDVWPRSRLLEAQERLAEVAGVTVLVHDQACAAEARRHRKRGKIPTPNQRVVINHRICEGCGDCGRVSNCLSVQPVDTPFGRKTQIDQTTCNLDFSCLEGDCPSFMTVSTKPSRFRRRRAAAPPKRLAPPTPPAVPEPVVRVPADEFSVRITGIGGTGVVTVAQVLGTAAMFDGFGVSGLDQIGLSQKAGPVVSDLRFSRVGGMETNRLGIGQADLLLALDQLVAASAKGLMTCDPARTVVVGSSSIEPTGAMITHPELLPPTAAEMADRIAATTADAPAHWADAAAITTSLFGDAVTVNTFVLGMAVQAGYLPVTPAAIRHAIELNGTAVSANLTAFEWGRAQVAARESVDAAVAASPHVGLVGPTVRRTTAPPELATRIADIARGDDELAAVLTLRAVDLVDYQDLGYARTYLDVLDRVSRGEADVDAGSHALALAVAENLYKLMAYKDEYEVARLMLDPDGLAAAREVAGGRARVSWRLHPPLLRALGMKEKLSIGAWATPGVRLLAAGKRLRGTVVDPFRWPEVRREERRLPGEYLEVIDEVLTRLDRSNLVAAVSLASLPDGIRGYEHLKTARIATFRASMADAIAGFRGADPSTSDV